MRRFMAGLWQAGLRHSESARVAPDLIGEGPRRKPRASLPGGTSIARAIPLCDFDLLGAAANEAHHGSFPMPPRDTFVGVTGAIIEIKRRLFVGLPLQNRERVELRYLETLGSFTRARTRVSRFTETTIGTVPNVAGKINIALIEKPIWLIRGTHKYLVGFYKRPQLPETAIVFLGGEPRQKVGSSGSAGRNASPMRPTCVSCTPAAK